MPAGAIGVLRNGARLAIRVSARDVTESVAARGALVLAPHPDDETLGCGATIARKLAAGSGVSVLAVTDGRHSHRSAALPPAELGAVRRREMAHAMHRLGLPAAALRWAELVDGSVAADEDRLVESIRSLLAELRPAEVYTTCADEPHPDHAAVGRAARRAVGGTTIQLLEYPVWLWRSWPLRRHDRLGSVRSAAGRALRRGGVVVRTGEYLPTKLDALRAHQSQLARPAPVPPEEEWPGLPASVLAVAAEPVELFFPVRG